MKCYLMIILLIILTILHFYCFSIEFKEYCMESIRTRCLENDGFCVLYDREYLDTTDGPCLKLQQNIMNKLPDGYIFLDYVYKINDTSLATFHRDVTSSQNVYKTKHPVYTAILYKYDGELLSVCPGSNKTYPFVLSNIVNISGKSGSVFLFDCELLHAGMKNSCKKREVIQYKICHYEDLHLLNHLSNIHVKKNDICKNDLYGEIVRKMSYYFQFPINTFLYPLMIKRENNNSLLGYIQSFIPLTYYNNT